MEVNIFTLCEQANALNNKLFIAGTFNSYSASSFPSTMKNRALAVGIHFSKLEEGKHDFVVKIIDADGKQIVEPLRALAEFRSSRDGNYSNAANVVIPVWNLEFSKPGDYSIELWIDGFQLKALPFVARKQSKQA